MLHRSEMYQEFAVRRRSLVDSRRSCSDVQSGSWFELLDDADVADLEPALGLVNRCPSASQLPLQHLKGDPDALRRKLDEEFGRRIGLTGPRWEGRRLSRPADGARIVRTHHSSATGSPMYARLMRRDLAPGVGHSGLARLAQPSKVRAPSTNQAVPVIIWFGFNREM